jgi:hypothetical protein
MVPACGKAAEQYHPLKTSSYTIFVFAQLKSININKEQAELKAKVLQDRSTDPTNR